MRYAVVLDLFTPPRWFRRRRDAMRFARERAATTRTAVVLVYRVRLVRGPLLVARFEPGSRR